LAWAPLERRQGCDRYLWTCRLLSGRRLCRIGKCVLQLAPYAVTRGNRAMSARSLERTRTELSAFLRKHRERLMPADVGLPSGRRRRTPGLRREEVAALAGV